MFYPPLKLILPAAPNQSSLTTIPLYDSTGSLLEIKSWASVVVSTFHNRYM